MNWLATIKHLLGRFWHEIFEDSDFLLGIEYLLSSYSQLVDNQYLNWRNGLIAKDLTVEQDEQPFLVFLDADIVREWFTWDKMWDNGSAKSLIDQTSNDTRGWITYSKDPIPVPFYMVDHTAGYSNMLVQGLDYDVFNDKFRFYTDPSALGLPVVKITDKDGMPHAYYRLFGYQKKTVKICDPVTGFESSWLNDCSDIVWDIHQNGVTYFNLKQLLGKVTDSVICEEDGTVDDVWEEQGYHCVSVNGKAYVSKLETTLEANDVVHAGDVIFGSLQVYKGSDNPTAAQVPGIRVQTDAGELVALNQDDVDSEEVDGMFVLPLSGNQEVLDKYNAICAANMRNANCPNIQVPPTVNPYKFVTQTLRRGRSVTVSLAAAGLERLAAAINSIRKSCCASGMVNVYVTAESAEADAAPYYHKLLAMVADEDPIPTPTKEAQQYYSYDTELIYTSYLNNGHIVWETTGKVPSTAYVYFNQADDNTYEWDGNHMKQVSKAYAATVKLSCFAADAGMLAVAAVETMKIKEACAEAEVIL